ncbi:hypothetical protein ACEPAG_2819 [Sanghuangporus baumii]
MDYSLLPKDNAVLSAVISRTENGKIHVLVDNHRKRFGKHTNWQIEEAFSDTLIDGPSLGENLSGTVKSRHSKTISLVKDASSPSTAADPANIQSQQSNFPIYNGRPDKFRGPPITIYNEAFARLKDDIDNLGDIIPTSTELEITFDLFKEAVKFYSVEPERTKVMFKLLEQFFDCPIRKEIRTLNSIGDGVIETETNASGWFAAIAWFELKNEIGSKGDAQYQAVCTYRKHVASDMYAKIRASTCCPCLIVSFMGPFMSIQGAIFIDAPVVQPFTEFFFLGGDPDYELRVLKIARILHATKNAIACIRRHYQQVELSATVNPEALLPCPVVIERPNPFPRIAFMDRLFKTSMVQPLYTGTMNGKNVIIKFTRRYCEGAHRLLAQNGLAPQLHLCVPVLGGYLMVVMDYVPGETSDMFLLRGPFTTDILSDIRKAMELLHREGYVFGDLRLRNILIVRKMQADADQPKPNGANKLAHGPDYPAATNDKYANRQFGAVLVDFDWCGRDSEARYPPTLNDTGDIDWAPGVERFGLMKKEHDEYLLRKLISHESSMVLDSVRGTVHALGV